MFGINSRANPLAAATRAGGEAVRGDPVLVELQFDLHVTRTILLAGSLIGLLVLMLLWWRGIVPNGYTVFFWALRVLLLAPCSVFCSVFRGCLKGFPA